MPRMPVGLVRPATRSVHASGPTRVGFPRGCLIVQGNQAHTLARWVGAIISVRGVDGRMRWFSPATRASGRVVHYPRSSFVARRPCLAMHELSKSSESHELVQKDRFSFTLTGGLRRRSRWRADRASMRAVIAWTLPRISSAVAVHLKGLQSLFQCSTKASISQFRAFTDLNVPHRINFRAMMPFQISI